MMLLYEKADVPAEIIRHGVPVGSSGFLAMSIMQPTENDPTLTIRDAGPMDRAELRRAVVELQEHERKLHDTRLPGEQTADAYLA
jgi:hypothetical protein